MGNVITEHYAITTICQCIEIGFRPDLQARLDEIMRSEARVYVTDADRRNLLAANFSLICQGEEVKA